MISLRREACGSSVVSQMKSSRASSFSAGLSVRAVQEAAPFSCAEAEPPLPMMTSS
jgi:hypothetical protein